MNQEDYYLRVQSLNQDKLHEEERRLHNLLFKIAENNPMYSQIQDMLDMVQSAQQEHFFLERTKHQPSHEVIEIGKIEETVYTPDYNHEDLLLAVVNQYTSKIRRPT